MTATARNSIPTLQWTGDALRLLDQRVLPERLEFVDCDSADAVVEAIKNMVVRGAPAIGASAAYAVVLAARDAYAKHPGRWRQALRGALMKLAAARPTAVNLRWALERMSATALTLQDDPVPALLAEAQAIHAEDVAANHAMGAHGAALIAAGSTVLTHCNAGALATSGYGTALGVIRAAHGQGRLAAIYATETRPWLQGARLTAWELLQDGIPVTLVADGAVGHLCRSRRVDWIILGADRVAANGDVVNKIGTYTLAVLAREHGTRFMVAAPTSTVDLQTPRGQDIPIETRDASELLHFAGHPVAARGAEAWNPVFDVTPAELVTVFVSERGVVERPDAAKIRAHMTS